MNALHDIPAPLVIDQVLPGLENNDAGLTRKIQYVRKAKNVFKSLWSYPPARGVDTLGKLAEYEGDFRFMPADGADAVRGFIASYLPLDTSTKGWTTDDRRSVLHDIIESISAEEATLVRRQEWLQ